MLKRGVNIFGNLTTFFREGNKRKMKMGSLKKKTVMFIFIITVFCTLGPTFMASQVLEGQMTDNYAADKEITIGILSYSLSPMLDLYNYKQVEQTITLSLNRESIVSIAVFDDHGTLIRAATKQNISTEELDMEKFEITTSMKGIIGTAEIGFSKKHINNRIRTMKGALVFGMMGFFALVGIILYQFMSRSIIEPLETFTETVKGMNSTKLSGRVNINRADEFGTLANSFNKMASSLEDSNRELREGEDRFRTIFNAVNDAIFVHDIETGVILDVNTRMCEMYGYSRDETLHLNIESLSLGEPPYTQQDAFGWIKKAARGEPQVFEWRAKHKTGDLFWIEVNMRQANISGQDRLLVVVRDISERKQAEEELQKAYDDLEVKVNKRTKDLAGKNKELEKSQKALSYLMADVNEGRKELEIANKELKKLDHLKSMFIASMSHELRTPLNSIIGFTGIILQGMTGVLNEKQTDHLSRVLNSAKHLLALITDIIDISKIEAGRIDVYPEEFALSEIVDEAIMNIQPQLKAKNLALKVDVPSELKMNTDRKRLLQCIINYLSNAVKFTEQGGIKIIAREIDGEVEIRVSDTGIGIARQDIPKLFKSFERLDSHLRVKAGGTGLGLYLTNKMTTELLKGTIQVESEEGKGSTFGLRIPKNIAPAEHL